MSISFLSDEDVKNGKEFIPSKNPTLLGYHTEFQPIQNTQVKITSINILLENCWDINSTAAILLFEKKQNFHIIRNSDFTDFLFGNQPIKFIYGKLLHFIDEDNNNFYDFKKSELRLIKACKKWY